VSQVRALALIASACLAAGLAGCAQIGSQVIRSGRPAYNDAILATNDQQLLQNIVRMRFGDGLGFLTVSSVTANVRVGASGTVNAGVGSESAYLGNLVPIAGAVSTEVNPTISYLPVSGDRVLRQLAGETPLDLAILSILSAHAPSDAWVWLVRRVNDIRSPDFGELSAPPVDPRFEEIARLLETLHRRGSLYWARLPDASSGVGFVLHGYAPQGTLEAERLLDLLGIPRPVVEGGDVIVPMVLAAGAPGAGTVAIETRSLNAMMRLAAAGVEVSGESRGALRFPPRGPGGEGVRIRSSAERPDGARVAIEYRGRWYYIDDADEASKRWFAMVALLFSAQVPETGVSVAPMLTIPVSGRR